MCRTVAFSLKTAYNYITPTQGSLLFPSNASPFTNPTPPDIITFTSDSYGGRNEYSFRIEFEFILHIHFEADIPNTTIWQQRKSKHS